MHLQGMGTSKDPHKAVHFYTKAAERGHVRAQASLAVRIVKADKAAAAAVPSANFALTSSRSICAWLFQKLLDTPGALHDPSKARHWLSEAAKAAHAESQFLLAQRLQAEADHHGAFRWHHAAAKGGHAHAQYIVGLAHVTDPSSGGTAAAAAAAIADEESRLRSGARWFAQACEQGNVGAQSRMGFMSYFGVGTNKDQATALMWLSNAAEAVSAAKHTARSSTPLWRTVTGAPSCACASTHPLLSASAFCAVFSPSE